jgi:hypothetical protein
LVILGFIVTIVILRMLPGEASFVYESPLLLLVLNTLLISVVAFVASYISAKSYVMSGSPGLLLLGCGMLTFGTGALVAGVVRGFPDGVSLNLIVYNTAALAASAFHVVAAALISMRVTSDLLRISRRMKAALAYLGVVVFVLILPVGGMVGVIPPFFIEGMGFTFLRQLVLGAAIVLFAVSSVLFMSLYYARRVSFLYWYSLALGVIAVGFVAGLLYWVMGDPLNWTTRAAQYVGGIYFLITVSTTVRATRS